MAKKPPYSADEEKALNARIVPFTLSDCSATLWIQRWSHEGKPPKV